MNSESLGIESDSSLGIFFEISGVYVMLPDNPSYVIKYTASVVYLDTINFVCSAFGLWFGLSVYGTLDMIINSSDKEQKNTKKLQLDKKDSQIDDRSGLIMQREWNKKMNYVMYRLMAQEQKIENTVRRVKLASKK